MLPADQNNFLINRDLSWLEFNRRVLEEAKDAHVPLLERHKFMANFSSNLDEFILVRVDDLKRQVTNQEQSANPDTGRAADLTAISQKVHERTEEQHSGFLDQILPQL